MLELRLLISSHLSTGFIIYPDPILIILLSDQSTKEAVLKLGGDIVAVEQETRPSVIPSPFILRCLYAYALSRTSTNMSRIKCVSSLCVLRMCMVDAHVYTSMVSDIIVLITAIYHI